MDGQGLKRTKNTVGRVDTENEDCGIAVITECRRQTMSMNTNVGTM
jgi:hypothetical protein